MYKNYKIGSDGSPKYSGNIYKVAPERRFTQYTDEWKRRLDGNSPRLRRRSNKRTENTFTIQVKHILYIIVFFMFVGAIEYSKVNVPMNMIQTSPIKVTLNNASRDFGNEFNKPNIGNQFLHVSLKFENISDDMMQINTNEFILLDDNNQKRNVLYSDYQYGSTTKELIPNSNTIGNITFEFPTTYNGELKLLFKNEIITRFNIQ